jgi:hypothetical protein
MNEFNQIQEIWGSQEVSKPNYNAAELIDKAKKQTKKLKLNHYWTIAIISLTTFVLLFYFIWTKSYQFNTLTIGLVLMIAMLIIRIFLEINSAKKLRNIKPNLSFINYSIAIKRFYKWRKKIHYIFTPIIYGTYFIGFTMLLPAFKANFSNWFFIYCLITGYGFFILFGIFLIAQIKKEIQLIEFLNSIK